LLFPKISPIIPVRRRDLFESAEWVYELKHRRLSGGRLFRCGRSQFHFFAVERSVQFDSERAEGWVNRKDGKYKPDQTLWYKILNPAYT